MTAVSFTVVGDPAAQGSKRHVGNGIMVESSKKTKPWRATVSAAAQDAYAAAGLTAPMDGPLTLDVVFRFPCPTSRNKTHKTLAADTGAPKVSAPDLDKLIRAVGDALTQSGLIRDDARIHSITASKIEVIGWTGAMITVTSLDPDN